LKFLLSISPGNFDNLKIGFKVSLIGYRRFAFSSLFAVIKVMMLTVIILHAPTHGTRPVGHPTKFRDLLWREDFPPLDLHLCFLVAQLLAKSA
jgi:hypothetical protein